MSVKRRLAAAGMPAAGVTVFAALALTGQPASAAPVDSSALAARPGVAVLAAPVAGGERGSDGYGDDTAGNNGSDDSDAGYDNGSDDNGSGAGNGSDDNGSGDNGSDDNGSDDNGAGNGAGNGSDDGTAGGDDRGNDGYGGVSPSSSPTPSPSASSPGGGTDNVPPGGVSPTTTAPGGGAGPDSVPGSGGGDTLPVTGAPMALVSTVGGLLVAFGAIAVWFSGRRRRSA